MTITDKYRAKYGPEMLELTAKMAALHDQIQELSREFHGKYPAPKGYAWTGHPPRLSRTWDEQTEEWSETDPEELDAAPTP